MKTLLLFFVALFGGYAFAQDSTFAVEDFNIKIQDAKLLVGDLDNKTVYDRQFQDPYAYTLDIDGDGASELLINDDNESEGQDSYTLYVYNTVGSFYLIDSIYSGLKEPYSFFSDEINNVVLVTGSPDFDSLNAGGQDVFSPLVCWSFVDSSLEIVNDQLYNVFLSENDANIDFMDSFFKEKGRNCESSQLLKAAIASAYANYIYADEYALADKLLEEYYLCEDLKEFKEQISKLL
ncbi:MAG: hypothetical protein HF314_05125 [Ignavibacteria bacterium]|jgi:hypothetical protein|nr:hypothetical protein [Ignavibacteria bacterium]MCU7502432.1 hypothetical protein [Ignavibacteria bacterium]MCU7515003.1 hypothetical protein [Ignavibacteria bacterium]